MATIFQPKTMQPVALNEDAVKIAKKIIMKWESCNLIAYPDPASDLYKALSTHNMLKKYLEGKIRYNDLPDNFKELSGAPWTCGYGETEGVTKDTAWTQEEADSRLDAKVKSKMTQCLKDCPELASLSAHRIAAITSLAYNIGNNAFKNSTAARLIKESRLYEVAEAIKMWNKAQGKVVDGLVNRRNDEAGLWNVG